MKVTNKGVSAVAIIIIVIVVVVIAFLVLFGNLNLQQVSSTAEGQPIGPSAESVGLPPKLPE